ncbi:MAG: hypothetical protein NTY61_01375 [Candidatus Parcubacteria bacterium]|nr:hypothetical protein [Candidatus Parcubacteria bacterium]
MDIILFCKNLKPEDWEKHMATEWPIKMVKVKDVVAHLVGWSKEVAQELPKIWGNKKEPWFMLTDNYGDFNHKTYQEYKNFTPEEILSELRKWQSVLAGEIEKIGEKNIRQRPHMTWVFDEGEEPHGEYHLNQIQKVINDH